MGSHDKYGFYKNFDHSAVYGVVICYETSLVEYAVFSCTVGLLFELKPMRWRMVQFSIYFVYFSSRIAYSYFKESNFKGLLTKFAITEEEN